jgi:hypothetical protein
MPEATKGYLYKFQFETLSKWEGGTDGDVYLVVGKPKPIQKVEPIGKINVSALSLSAGTGNSLQVDIIGPPIAIIEDPAFGMDGVCLKIDTADAPGDNSFEQGDTDVCFFAFKAELPIKSGIHMTIVGRGKDDWSYRLKIFSVGTQSLTLVFDSGEKTTRRLPFPGIPNLPKHVHKCLASCHIDKTGQCVSLGHGNLPGFVKIDDLTPSCIA